MQSNHVRRIQQLYNHINPHNNSPNTKGPSIVKPATAILHHVSRRYTAKASTGSKPFRTVHTGIINDPDAATYERKRQLRLDLRGLHNGELDQAAPYTSILLLDHVLHVSKLLKARHIHLKYVEASGDCYIMFRTEKGLVTYSTINNKHWIRYMLMHATGQEDPQKAGEGEFRLEVLSDRDGRMDFAVNIVYIQGGVKLTVSPVS